MVKIYTKTGDRGKTISFDQTPTSKNSLRIHAVGSLDELNSVLGMVISQAENSEITRWLKIIQADLFQFGSYLSGKKDEVMPLRRVNQLEMQIDHWQSELQPLTQFILPGGTILAAQIHYARTVCRRAERHIVAYHETESLPATNLEYINRLSDWLFVLARMVNARGNTAEDTWVRTTQK
ncbi:cob(I)yrinic acid a,c-diamide adenosyltransferase [candidate division WWE3 bacterium]|uniref:Corrinoid adenosyltransferase n=1 Tax=candidate division WWE3 bacterium TaxID=2053526 RepID=A0A955LGK1_UNCKA|nr:cob(I)yrinic acid a,c-diamide adenosyltransferase [candidate division WWE3 bacterium]